MTNPTRVQQASEELQKIIGDLEDLVKEAQIGMGRKQMYLKLRTIGERLRRLVSALGSL